MKEIEIGSTKKIHCNTCKVDTHHQLKAKHTGDRINEYGFGESFFYKFWICRGCDTASLETISIDLVDDKKTYQLYPNREFSDSHLDIKKFFRLNEKLTQIYKEVIISFNSDANILCAIGLRALLEGICFEKEIAGNNLYEKIGGLRRYLPSNIVENLHSFRFMGNTAAHELQFPERHELKLAIEIVEDLLNFLYELEYKSQDLLEFSKKETKNRNEK